MNTVLQGSAAEIMKVAMARVHDQLEARFPSKAAIVMQLHDELLVEAHSDVADSVIGILHREMENVDHFNVTFRVKSKRGTLWGQLE